MPPARTAPDTCTRCDRGKPVRARGLCVTCYRKARIDGEFVPNTIIDAAEARQKIVELTDVHGWNYAEMSRALNVDRLVFVQLVRGKRKRVLERTANAILNLKPEDRALYRRTNRDYSESRIAEAKKREAAILAAAESSAASVVLGPWQFDALCRQTYPEVFFPKKGSPGTSAKKVCQACPVQTQCLEYALSSGERYGIWGGKSERERAAILRARNKELGLPDSDDYVDDYDDDDYDDDDDDDREDQIA